MDGKTALGASSPANPALHMPEPLSTTRAATSSSHILLFDNLSIHLGFTVVHCLVVLDGMIVGWWVVSTYSERSLYSVVLPVGPVSESERPTQSDTIISLPFPNKGIVPAPTVIGDSRGSCPTIGVSVRPSTLYASAKFDNSKDRTRPNSKQVCLTCLAKALLMGFKMMRRGRSVLVQVRKQHNLSVHYGVAASIYGIVRRETVTWVRQSAYHNISSNTDFPKQMCGLVLGLLDTWGVQWTIQECRSSSDSF